MARRRRQGEEQESHERWLVSYADFITLLFAFFVVMYSVSSVNEGKYRVLSNTLTEAFQEPRRSVDPIQVGELQRASGALTGDAVSQSLVETRIQGGPQPLESVPSEERLPGFEADKGPAPEPAKDPAKDPANDPTRAFSEEKRLGYIADTIESVLEPFIQKDLASVTHNRTWVEVDLKSQLLFESGNAHLSREALAVLRDISRILKPLPNPVHVEGYTDNVPIHTTSFPSNWELSASRAASVVNLFQRLGVHADRLAAIGYGEHRPIADNATEDGRQRNRRVTLVILTGDGAGARAGRTSPDAGRAP